MWQGRNWPFLPDTGKMKKSGIHNIGYSCEQQHVTSLTLLYTTINHKTLLVIVFWKSWLFVHVHFLFLKYNIFIFYHFPYSEIWFQGTHNHIAEEGFKGNNWENTIAEFFFLKCCHVDPMALILYAPQTHICSLEVLTSLWLSGLQVNIKTHFKV